ncbi:: SAF [Gemmataceae bacterium]|nr:: SAF [Gemmataceae bacterium]VTU01602.1 : SAF [Gemmataceae bacterium]
MSASCCGSSRRTAALVVMAVALCVLIPAVVVLGVKASREPPPTPPVETVDVVVAADELPAGTLFGPGNVERLTAVKAIPVAALPEGTTLVTSRAELVGKRLTRTAHRGEWLVGTDLNRARIVWSSDGSEIMSIPMPTKTAVAEEVRPGSRFDLIVSYSGGAERHVFTLLPDLEVLAVNGVQDLPLRIDATEERTMLSFAVNHKQDRLLGLANQRECELAVVPRRPGTSRSAWDYDATLARLKGLGSDVPEAEREVAPFPRAVP